METAEPLPQSRKRARQEELFLLDDWSSEGMDSMPKRACNTAPEEEPHLSFLEDLCGLDNTQEGNILESDSQEDLVLEMMKSLEKVIGSPEESGLPQPILGSQETQDNLQDSTLTATSSTPDLASALFNEALAEHKEGSDSSESEVNIRFLFEASDDELGIPPSPNSEGETLLRLREDASSWLDVSYSNTGNMHSMPENQESWRFIDRQIAWQGTLDGNWDLERDYYYLGHSEDGLALESNF